MYPDSSILAQDRQVLAQIEPLAQFDEGGVSFSNIFRRRRS